MESAAVIGDRDVARRRARGAAGLLVSLIALAGIVLWASDQESPRLPDDAGHTGLLLAAVALYGVVTLARGIRWDHLLRHLQIRHSSGDARALLIVGYMGNAVLPARGGEVLRIFLLAERSDARRREVLGSIISERVLDVVALALAFGVLGLSGLAAPAGFGGALVTLACGAVLVGALLLYQRLRVAGRFAALADRIRPVTRSSGTLLTPTGARLGLLSVAIWLVEGVIFWLCAQSVSVGLDPPEAAAAVTLGALSGVIPAGPGYVGTYDATVLFALHAFDVTGGDAISCLLLYRLVAFGPITIAGFFLLITRYGGLREALRRARAPEASD